MSGLDWGAPASVYRCYDAEGDLIYIGCSTNVEKRMADHTKTIDCWVQDVQYMEIEPFDNLRLARKAESRAIANEHPYRNVVGRWPHRSTWTEAEYQRWGHMLLRPRPEGMEQGVQNYEQLEALNRIYMIVFGHSFPKSPAKGSSRRRYQIEVAA